jgi:inorganic triphosphatase YgiF
MAVHIEHEMKLQVPRRFDLGTVAEGLNGFSAGALTARRLSTVYYDSDDLRLTRWGCSLRYRSGDGWTVKFPSSRSNGALVRVEHTFEGSSRTPPAQALALLSAYLRGKTVGPVAKLRTLRKSMAVHGDAGEELAEIVDDDVRVLDDRKVVDRFREIEIELCDGAPPATLDVLRRCLQAAGAGAVDETPKNVRALGAPATAPPEVYCAHPDALSTAEDVVRYALGGSVRTLLRCDAPLRVSMDAETVHQARVATRRLRSDLRTFMPLLEGAWAAALRDKIAWLADELGSVRDADVLLARLHRQAGTLPPKDANAARVVIDGFEVECRRARKRLAEVLQDRRYVELLDELVAAAAHPQLDASASAPARATLPQLVDEHQSETLPVRGGSDRAGRRQDGSEIRSARGEGAAHPRRSARCRGCGRTAARDQGRA